MLKVNILMRWNHKLNLAYLRKKTNMIRQNENTVNTASYGLTQLLKLMSTLMSEEYS